MINSLEKLLKYNLPTYGSLVSPLVYKSKAGQTDQATVTLDGYVAFLYYKNFQESYPKFPTPIQKERINAIWDALGHPEKKLP